MKKNRTPIGKFLVARGLLSLEEEKEVAAEQRKLGEDNYEAFGKIAVRKGFITDEKVKAAIKERRSLEEKR